jgi:hypothetical protein
MNNAPHAFKFAVIIGLAAIASACIVAPERNHEGYWDREHSRYWHEGGWHPCAEHAEACR